MYDEVNIFMSLNELKPGEAGTIERVEGEGALRRRLLDMGLTPGTRVAVRKVAPFGDPYELFLRGYELTLRGEDARIIKMRKEAR
jgi:Fe2+ transport system protein FeoA